MKRLILAFLVCLLPPLTATRAAVQEKPAFTRTEDVVYGRKFGTALTLDVFQPAKPNGYGVIFLASGGWLSSRETINAAWFQAELDRGYTVFAIVHGSQPRFIIPEIIEDIHRAVRFIRYHAAQYGIRSDAIGMTGASAGGHLSLTMGVQGGPGKADAKDPIDRESSAIQVIACFFPPTDFLNYGQPGVDAVGVGLLKKFKPAFGPRADTEEGRRVYGRELSPAYFVTDKFPPTLIIHGDADRLVPFQQSELFVQKAREAGAREVKLIRREGKDHGWKELPAEIPILADWFDLHLRGIKP